MEASFGITLAADSGSTGMIAMLARQPDAEDGFEEPTNRLTVVGDRLPAALRERPNRQRPRRARRFRFLGDFLARLREQARLQPEQAARLRDRLILLGIAIVVAVSVYIFIADPS